MDNVNICLTWNSQGFTYQQMLNNFRIRNVLTDCTLACDGQKFSVHKLVLITCSDFFKSILEDVTTQHPIIYLRGVSGKEMEILINFMYLGKIDISHSEMEGVLSTAESLCIKGLGVVKSEPDCPMKIETASENTLETSESTLVLLKDHSANDADSEVLFLTSHRRVEEEPSQYVPKELPSIHTSDSVFAESVYPSNQSVLEYSTSEVMLAMNKSSPFDSSSIPQLVSVPTPLFVTSFRESGMNTSVKCLQENSQTEQSPLQTTPASKSSNVFNEIQVLNVNHVDPNSIVKTLEMPNIKNEVANFSEVPLSDASAAINRSSALAPPLSCRPDSAVNFVSSKLPTTANNNGTIAKYARQEYIPIQDENLDIGLDSSRPHLCPICNKSFAKLAILKRHHLAHFRPYNCHICARSFTRREVLTEHLQEHNGADMRLPCPVCNMTIKRKRNLQAHIKVKHPEYLRKSAERSTVGLAHSHLQGRAQSGHLLTNTSVPPTSLNTRVGNFPPS